jgi:N-acetylglucosamine repressor
MVLTEECEDLSSNKLKKKKRYNNQIIKLLYEHTEMTIPSLCSIMGLTSPTIKSFLNDLIADGIVKCDGTAESKGGRKASLYSLIENYQYVVSCDMGRYTTRMAIFNCKNQLISDITNIDTNIYDDGYIEKICTAYNELLAKNKIPEQKVLGLGLDMPGLVDAETGINYTIEDEKLQNVRKLLDAQLHKYIYVDNDARMQAYGEYTFGKANGKKNAIVLNWNWGLGLGLILNGQLYNGTTGFAGEFSHIKMQDEGELCICGKKGCIETVSSATHLVRLVKNALEEGIQSQLYGKFTNNIDGITPDDIVLAVKAGDEVCINALHKVGLALGKGLAMLIQLLNPEIIVFQGPVSKANQYVLTPIQQSLNRYCLERFCNNLLLEISELDTLAGLLGTTAQVFHTYYAL